MKRNLVGIGSFVKAGVKAGVCLDGVRVVKEDPQLARLNESVDKIFEQNGLTEGRKMTWKDFCRQLVA